MDIYTLTNVVADGMADILSDSEVESVCNFWRNVRDDAQPGSASEAYAEGACEMAARVLVARSE